ncbi:MAG: YicC family protein [Congregibacter sp.]
MKLHSMTAFARETAQTPTALAVELRSVNHRYLDCHFKLPDSLRALEPRLREGLGKALKRGKVDCYIRVIDEGSESSLHVDKPRLQAVLQALNEVCEQAPDLAKPDALALLQFPGICDGGGRDESQLHSAVMALFQSALASLQDNREREGKQLDLFLRQRLEGIAEEVKNVREALPALRERQEARLRQRLEELALAVDEGRLEQELVILLQKSDVDEELDRLEAHIKEIEHILEEGGPCGRRLDFLMQELNREANTLASKSIASSTTQSAVELKVLIEQMREQVQNIE